MALARFTHTFFVTATPSRRWFFYGVAILLLVFAAFLLTVPKAEGFFQLRAFHPAWLNFTMRWLTHLGDGVFALLLVIWFWYRRQKALALLLVVGYAFSGLLSQLSKMTFSADRPKLYFSKLGVDIFQVSGVAQYNLHSFPSGHTITAFALATLLVLHFSPRFWGIGALLLAVAVGYSRIYLGQHFPADVLAGLLVGVCSSIIVHATLAKRLSVRWPALASTPFGDRA